ncbi:protein-L-isoaspartate O-methyltransferase family protein [Chelatococcus reniformis]|uniref:Protein-L-isoaspartate O-methyltransferase n=1 Tax=Chelatococcus reniformis TaxID=1494448 RepID=A0A916TXD7_9HYPH|nr:rRNA adenine N-6-methyltransferase family protein [Chelatococcus reniformis]GGC50790.1 hypothetical protein GCM10010994_07420 [Chelatococcus reniformis]
MPIAALPPHDAPFTPAELALARRAYARQMLAIAGIENAAIARGLAAVSREAFVGDPPWRVSTAFGTDQPLAGTDPVVLYQDVVVALDAARGVNNGSPSLHAKLLDALGPRAGDHVVHIGAGTGYYSAILAELVGPAGQVTAVEVDPALARRATAALSGRTNVRVVCGDGAVWPQTPVDGIYVNFGVIRPADPWIEHLVPDGRLVFWLGGPGPERPAMGGRHSDRGAALCVQRQARGRAARAVSPAYFVCAEGGLAAHDEAQIAALARAFGGGGLDRVRSLVWKRPIRPDRCWFAGNDWALSTEVPTP